MIYLFYSFIVLLPLSLSFKLQKISDLVFLWPDLGLDLDLVIRPPLKYDVLAKVWKIEIKRINTNCLITIGTA
jgi:hypothetical protein